LFTHKDDPDEEIWFRSPRALAEQKSIAVYDPENLRERAWTELLRKLAPDFIFSFYYRYMLPQEMLDAARVAALNMHGSLLPKFRGRCPVNWVLIAGEEKTGVTLHVMEAKPDAGDIVGQKEVAITFDDTAHSLFLKLAQAARDLMHELLPRLQGGTFTRIPQTGQSSYYGGRKPEDGRIDWHNDAHAIYNLVRAVARPYPGAFTLLDGRKLFIWKALPEEVSHSAPAGQVMSTDPLLVAAGKGALRLLSLQLADGPPLTAEEFASTHQLAGKQLGGTS
jgi:methionyl-tRNA formyltransferase